MALLLAKVFLSALFIGGVNILASRFPALGGYVAVLPIITFLSLITLMVDRQTSDTISMFLTGALAGVALTSLVLILMLLLVRGGLPSIYAILLGMTAWVIFVFVGPRLFP